MRPSIRIVCFALMACPTLARSQTDPTILFSSPFGWESNPIGTAIANLDLQDETEVINGSEPVLLAALRSQAWELVIIRRFGTLDGADGAAIIDELAAHVDRGGKLMFSMARLDEQPELWPLLGLAGASDYLLPVQRIVAPREGLVDPGKRHPAFSSRPALGPAEHVFGPDYGDVPLPAAGSHVIAMYEEDQSPAIVLSANGAVITNGQEWDNWDARGVNFAEDQVNWLISCPADLDGDGDPTVFDFFEFQNRFDSGGASGFADFDYDGRLDVFDFLEFFNMFQAGC